MADRMVATNAPTATDDSLDAEQIEKDYLVGWADVPREFGCVCCLSIDAKRRKCDATYDEKDVSIDVRSNKSDRSAEVGAGGCNRVAGPRRLHWRMH